MKYTLYGYSQEKLIQLGLKHDHALLLRWFSDFIHSDKIVKIMHENTIYYWIKYDAIQKDLPILGIKKDSVYRMLKKMADIGVLKRYTLKQAGTFSYYAFGKNYYSLGYKSEPSEKNPYPSGKKSVPPTEKNPEQIINLQKDSSTKDKNNIYTDEFDFWWKIYPSAKGKQSSFNAFKKLTKQEKLDLIKSTNTYKQIEKKKIAEGYVYSPYNFLNKGYWVDYLNKGQQEDDKYKTKCIECGKVFEGPYCDCGLSVFEIKERQNARAKES